MVHPLTNVLADWALQASFDLWGPAWAARVVEGIAVEVFFWGAFFFIATITGMRRWMMVPSLAMLAYGLIFHFGFLNFYLSTGFCLWLLALPWNPSRRRIQISIPLAVLALLAHALPLAWAGAALIYVHAARRGLGPARANSAVGHRISAAGPRSVRADREVPRALVFRSSAKPTRRPRHHRRHSILPVRAKYAVVAGGMLLLSLLLLLKARGSAEA